MDFFQPSKCNLEDYVVSQLHSSNIFTRSFYDLISIHLDPFIPFMRPYSPPTDSVVISNLAKQFTPFLNKLINTLPSFITESPELTRKSAYELLYILCLCVDCFEVIAPVLGDLYAAVNYRDNYISCLKHWELHDEAISESFVSLASLNRILKLQVQNWKKVEEFAMENGDHAAPGTRVGEVELVAESAEELKDLPSHNESDNVDVEGEDQNNGDSTETYEVYKRSSHLVSGAIGNELKGVDDEEKWLSSGIADLQQKAFYIHRALDSNNLKDALKYSAQMLSELRTSKLSPHKYYELYMRAFDELRKLEMFFKEETARGCSIVELYELVQQAGNILPRLYLLCTAGSVYVKSKETPAKDVLKDLVEMCRGIQHPVRGLFLRSYLSQVSRDKLPEVSSEYEGDADTVTDAVEFVLQNFTEMNKLWVRMQHQGPIREKEKREKERNELRDLVGKNLHVLSQIEGLDLDMYQKIVLPRVLEQVVNCKDEPAQYYLMDCIIQVLPDEYHLQTLETSLHACPLLQSSVDVKTVLARLMERLSNYAASGTEVLPEFFQVEDFAKLNISIGKVIEAQYNMSISGVVTLYASLLTFTLQVHSDRLNYVDQILGECVSKLSRKGKLDDSKATKSIVALLSAPLDKYKDIDIALKLSNYPRLVEYLTDGTNKEMANVIIQSIKKNIFNLSQGKYVAVENLELVTSCFRVWDPGGI